MQELNMWQEKFLRALVEADGFGTPQEIGPQISQRDNSARQTCKRRGWVKYDHPYWIITDAGRRALTD